MSQPKRIQRKRTKGWRIPKGAVYVGRPTRWGNPYRLTDYRFAHADGTPKPRDMKEARSMAVRDFDTAETRLLARGRAYPSRNALALAARRAERRTGWVLVDVRDAAPTPAGGDADGWDAYRLARGITGSR